MNRQNERLPTLFVSHGGGPWPFAKDAFGQPAMWDGLEAHLRGLDAEIGQRPKAVLVISAHWEAQRPTINVGKNPPMLFDYYGFPPQTYRLSYTASGDPVVAARIRALLASSGFDSDEDDRRGFDHGVFIPFMLIYPNADVPIVQMSLQRDLDPAFHLALGRALAPLRDENVLIVGSGLSYHNLRKVMADDARTIANAEHFDAWLEDAVTHADAVERERRLIAWESAPGARDSHPRSEHLAPLFVVAGAAEGEHAVRNYADTMFGKPVSGFRFG